MGIELLSVIGVVDQFYFLHELQLGFIEVGIGRVDDQAYSAGFGYLEGLLVELFEGTELIVGANGHAKSI